MVKCSSARSQSSFPILLLAVGLSLLIVVSVEGFGTPAQQRVIKSNSRRVVVVATTTTRTTTATVLAAAAGGSTEKDEEYMRWARQARSAEAGDEIVEFPRPLGLILNADAQGNVYVEKVAPKGNAARTGKVCALEDL
jgi:hypothetical protein